MLIALIFATQLLQGQKIVKNEVDKFSKQKRIETSNTDLVSSMSVNLAVKLRSVGDSYYALFYGYGKSVGIISPNHYMQILFDNDSILKIYPTSMQSYSIGTSRNYYQDHQYNISKEDLQMLSTQKIKSIRRYTSEGYSDFELKEKFQDNFKELTILFLKYL